MKQIKVTRQDNQSIPQIGAQLSVEDRLKIIANLIIDRILEDEKRKLIIDKK